MTIVCPTVTAYDPHAYREQVEKLTPFATRMHIDLMDGHFAPTKSPDLKHIWWPDNVTADLHLMYKKPLAQMPIIVKLRPNLVIIHAEAEVDHAHFANGLHKVGIRSGLALLPETPVDQIKHMITHFEHVLIFSGHLGYHGGQADLNLLDKIRQIKDLRSDTEIGWDGGVNDHNAARLADAGVDVLNVGGFIAGADDPKVAYAKLETVIRAP